MNDSQLLYEINRKMDFFMPTKKKAKVITFEEEVKEFEKKFLLNHLHRSLKK